MGTPTLFGDADEIARPREYPPERVVRHLIALGLSEDTARGYDARQAVAVRAKLVEEQKDREAAAEADRQAALARAGEVKPREYGASLPERLAAAEDLERMLECEMGDAYERLCARLVYSLYPLTRAAFVRVVRAAVRELRSQT